MPGGQREGGWPAPLRVRGVRTYFGPIVINSRILTLLEDVDNIEN